MNKSFVAAAGVLALLGGLAVPAVTMADGYHHHRDAVRDLREAKRDLGCEHKWDGEGENKFSEACRDIREAIDDVKDLSDDK